MDVSCGNCSKRSLVNNETVFCQYCGSKYLNFSVNIPRLIELSVNRESLRRRLFNRILLTFIGLSTTLFIILFSNPSFLPFFHIVVLVWLALFCVCAPVIQTFHEKKMARIFPELYV